MKDIEKRRNIAGYWWQPALFIAINHVIAIWVIVWRSKPQDPVIYYVTLLVAWVSLLGITAGYHRLWSHGSYKASLPLKIILAFFGTISFQGSIRWWVLRHRLHHRFTDTDQDPYNSRRGLLYSHIGWLLVKPASFHKITMIDCSDLDNDMVVYYQKKFMLLWYVISGALLPSLLGFLLVENPLDGFLWIGMVGRCISWHCTWSINSLAHWMGDKEYSEYISATKNLLCAILLNGEGYHNYHHEFPKDYRHGIAWYHWDPTKWVIYLLSWLGMASDLVTTPSHHVRNSYLQVLQRKVAQQLKNLHYGPEPTDLPSMKMEDFLRKCKDESQIWIMLDGYVLDVSQFKDHPGGTRVLQNFKGKDATWAFNGGLNNHTQSARNLSRLYRVASISNS